MHTPSKNAYPLTTEQFLLEIDIFAGKSGKQDAYHGKHNSYQSKYTSTVVSTRDGTPMSPAYQEAKW